jgi:selenocysteine lyase/cysteine desulfurase
MNQSADRTATIAYTELEASIFSALETYSNVHRGSGHFSIATTHLFEEARSIVLDYLHLKTGQYQVIFCTSRGAEIFKKQITPDSCHCLSSRDFGLSLGVYALAVKKKALARLVPFHVGGGTARLISKDWVIWAKSPDKFEAGTPAIINVIAFAKALKMIQSSGKEVFLNSKPEKLAVAEILYHHELEKLSGPDLLRELRKIQVGQGIQVPTKHGIRSFINLDNSASTPTFKPIFSTFIRALNHPESIQKEIIQEVKSIISGFLNAPPSAYEVIFTSNTTEAINLAAESFSIEFGKDTEPVVLNTLLEHTSNELPWRMIPNAAVIRLSVNMEGFLDLNEIETLLTAYNREGQYGKKRIRIVAVSGASNVLGICNNIAEISRIAHHYGARLLVDGAQLVAHRKVEIDECSIDYFTFSAHKVYAPFGSGALVFRKGFLHFSPKELELIQSSGEENTAGIAALGKALLLLNRIGMGLIEAEEQALASKVLKGLAQINGLAIYGIKDPESSDFSNKIGVIPFTLKNKLATQVGEELALAGGIGVRSGCHCAHITVKHILKVGPGLEKFQKMIVSLFPKLSLPGVVRISFGIENTEDDINRFVEVLQSIADKSKSSSKKDVRLQVKDFARASANRVYK